MVESKPVIRKVNYFLWRGVAVWLIQRFLRKENKNVLLQYYYDQITVYFEVLIVEVIVSVFEDIILGIGSNELELLAT